MITLNSPIKASLMLREGRQAVAGEDYSYLAQTLFEDSDSPYSSLSPPVNSLQANEMPKQIDSSTPPVPYGGEFKFCRDWIPRRSMSLQHRLGSSSYIRNLGTPSSVLLGDEHLSPDLDPYVYYHKKGFVKANV